MPPVLKFEYQEQEALVLDAAAKCIEASSLLDFTMSAISKAAGVSMGSIYKHIQSKEDVLVALGYLCVIHFEKMARKVMSLPLPLTARILAVQLVEGDRTYPYSFGPQLISLLGNVAVLRRASPGWLKKYIAADITVETIFQQQLVEACDTGELVVDSANKDALVEEILTSVWAICIGHDQVLMQRNTRNLIVKNIRLESDSTVVRGIQRLLNTYPWKTALTDELIEDACQMLKECGLR